MKLVCYNSQDNMSIMFIMKQTLDKPNGKRSSAADHINMFPLSQNTDAPSISTLTTQNLNDMTVFTSRGASDEFISRKHVAGV